MDTFQHEIKTTILENSSYYSTCYLYGEDVSLVESDVESW